MTNREIQQALDAMIRGNERATESLAGYASTMRDIIAMQKKVKAGKKQEAQLQKEINKLQQKLNSGRITADERRRLQVLRQTHREVQRITREYEAQAIGLERSLSTSTLMLSSVNTLGKGVSKLGGFIKANTGYWLENLKAIKTSHKSMGLLANQYDSYSKLLTETAYYTSSWLVDVKDLAETQVSMSETLGKNQLLTMKHLKTLASAKDVLNLSNSEVGQMAGSFESINGTTDNLTESLERVTKKSRQFGLNTKSVFNNLQGIVKLANKFSFKNGIKDMEKMALYSTKYKMNIDSVASIADKLFDVEGAIEMGAQLQVLGGKWAQIGDPMNLMYKARNDIKGLADDLITAASASAQWNEQNKAFEISSLELHRMRGVAEMTGMTLEELRDMAIATAKASKIEAQISTKITDPEMLEHITSVAEIGKNGRASITIDGKKVNVDALGDKIHLLTKILNDNKKMEQIAKDSKTFDERFQGLVMKAKGLMTPLVEKVDKWLTKDVFNKIENWLVTNGPKILDGVDRLGKTIESVLNWVSENPIKTIMITAGAILGKVLLNGAMWYANGMSLARGFNRVVNIAGGATGGSNGFGPGGTGGKGKFGKFGRFMGKASPYAIAAGIGLEYGSDIAIEKGMMDKGGDAHKTTNLLSSVIAGAGTGAMAGGIAGTVVPVLGNGIGAGIGGIVGGAVGLINGIKQNQQMDDFIARPGEKPIPFNSADTLVGLKKDGGLGKALYDNVGNKGNSGNTIVSFEKPLTINGEIKLVGNAGTLESIDLKNNPILLRELTKLISDQLTKDLAGGKLTSSPI